MKRHYNNIFIILLIVLNAFSSCAHKDDSLGVANIQYYLSDLSIKLKTKWPNNNIINIVCYGHSVTSGYSTTPFVDTFNAYPHLLHKGLKKRFPYAVINVIVSGNGGENSEHASKRFDEHVLAYNPDIITIDYALNDRYIGLQSAKASWASMIEKAKAKGIKVLLLTPTADTSSDLNNPKNILSQHAQQIRDLAKTYHVGLVDSYAEFKDYVNKRGDLKNIMSSKNHPNRKGHELIVKRLLEWFQ